MFDIGFWEIALIGAVALLVVGPERLPGMARTIGFWVGKVRYYVQHVKDDIEREMHIGQIKEIMDKPNQGMGEILDTIEETKESLKEVKQAVDAAGADFESSVSEAEKAIDEAAVTVESGDHPVEQPTSAVGADSEADPDADTGATDNETASSENEPRAGQG